ncbi:MAG: hypothetical protein ACRCZI_11145 [Cetobacterium sp.]
MLPLIAYGATCAAIAALAYLLGWRHGKRVTRALYHPQVFRPDRHSAMRLRTWLPQSGLRA